MSSPEDRRKYEGDVYYEVWRSGGNPDAIDFDHMDDHRWNGDSAESAAACALRRQRPSPQEEQQEEQEDDQ
ncbi:MAG: hypothetical protein KJ954_14370 [Alphaproteobacteria bacterium]|nr:hypothetical protein [Alphaproteobacteria bacterium]